MAGDEERHDLESFIERFDAMREKRGWSRAETARRVGLNVHTVASYFKGRARFPPADHVALIADALGTSVEFLVFGRSAVLTDRDDAVYKELCSYLAKLPTETLYEIRGMLKVVTFGSKER